MPKDQSAYRCGHSTVAAILKIFRDVVDAAANGRVALLGLLDLSAAFYTVDHTILLCRLKNFYSLRGRALDWIVDYLTDRKQLVCCGGSRLAQ